MKSKGIFERTASTVIAIFAALMLLAGFFPQGTVSANAESQAAAPVFRLPYDETIRQADGKDIRALMTGRIYEAAYKAEGLTYMTAGDYHGARSDSAKPSDMRGAIDFTLNFKPVYATAEGTVYEAPDGGKCHIRIDHGNGYTSYYEHLSERYVKVGDHVTAQTVIGKSGNGCGSNGAHLHFAVFKDGYEIAIHFVDASVQATNGIVHPSHTSGDPTYYYRADPKNGPPSPGVLQLSQGLSLSTTAPTPGQSVTASFKVKNVGGMAMTLQNLSAGARLGADWNGTNVDFPAATNITLQPNQEISYQQSRSFDAGGSYFAEPVVQINGQWGGIPLSNGGFSRVNFSIAVPGLPPVPAPPAAPAAPPVAPAVDYRFLGGPSSSLKDNNGSADLTVCADNIVNRTVYVNFRRPDPKTTWKVWTFNKKATSRCVTFKDMDGSGPLNGGTLYESRAALDQQPSTDWSNTSCYAGNSKQQGLCDTVRKGNQK
jgi:hypothetical protein